MRPIVKLHRESGQSLIEVAFVLPVLLLLGLLMLDFGIAMDERAQLVQGLREGGRSAAAGADETEIVARTVSESDGLIQNGDVTVCYLDGDDAGVTVGDIEDAARIEVSHTYEIVVAGELMSLIGLNPSFDISPAAEAQLLSEVPGATPC